VQGLGVDFLVCSSYKFFGPHLGILYGKEALLERLHPYQLRPAPHDVPDKFETGTKNHECLAGLVGTLEYLSRLGGQSKGISREAIVHAMERIRAYELSLSAALLAGLASVPGLRLYGITDPSRLHERVPTYAFNLVGRTAPDVGRALASEGIFVWTGNYYALEIMEKLGLEGKGGAVRVGAVHYNTADEIDRLVSTLKELGKRQGLE
jgi:selenocysteine lyase/cysteine desulfurase